MPEGRRAHTNTGTPNLDPTTGAVQKIILYSWRDVEGAYRLQPQRKRMGVLLIDLPVLSSLKKPQTSAQVGPRGSSANQGTVPHCVPILLVGKQI